MNFMDSPLSKPAPYLAAPIEHRFEPYEDNGGYVLSRFDLSALYNTVDMANHLLIVFDSIEPVLPSPEKTFVSSLQTLDKAMDISLILETHQRHTRCPQPLSSLAMVFTLTA